MAICFMLKYENMNLFPTGNVCYHKLRGKDHQHQFLPYKKYFLVIRTINGYFLTGDHMNSNSNIG